MSREKTFWIGPSHRRIDSKYSLLSSTIFYNERFTGTIPLPLQNWSTVHLILIGFSWTFALHADLFTTLHSHQKCHLGICELSFFHAAFSDPCVCSPYTNLQSILALSIVTSARKVRTLTQLCWIAFHPRPMIQQVGVSIFCPNERRAVDRTDLQLDCLSVLGFHVKPVIQYFLRITAQKSGTAPFGPNLRPRLDRRPLMLVGWRRWK